MPGADKPAISEELIWLADAFDRLGGDIASWPTEASERARRLLAEVPEAEAIRRRANALAAILNETTDVPAPAWLKERIAAEAASLHPPAAADSHPILAGLWPFGPIWRPATGLALALIIGLVIGSLERTTGVNAGVLNASAALSEDLSFLSDVSEMEDLE